MKHNFDQNWWIHLVLIVIAVLFAHRWIFSYQFDSSYMHNLYDHSQWRIPQSSRVIGDNELYQVAGDRLLNGGELFTVAPEVPPLVKLLYGWSILLTGNPYWVSVGFYLVCFPLIYWVVRQAGFSRRVTRLSVLVLSLSPIVMAQLGQTMLDLPQLVFMLLFVGGVQQLLQSRCSAFISQLGWGAVAGLGLGLFAATKVPVFVPLFLVISCLYLIFSRKWVGLITMILTVPLVYLGTFYPHFIAGNSLWSWLQAQKWMVSFYIQSGSSNWYIWPILVTASTGLFIGWWGDATWIRVSDWSLIWPLSVGVVVWFWWKWWRVWVTQSKSVAVESKVPITMALLSSLLIALMIIPFWPRYMVLFIPLAVPYVLRELVKYRRVFMAVVVIVGIQFVRGLYPQPWPVIEAVSRDFANGNFQDSYRHTTPSFRSEVNLQDFHHTLKLYQYQAEVTNWNVMYDQAILLPGQVEVQVPVQVEYQTRMGNISYPVMLRLEKIQGQWQIENVLNLVLADMQPGDQIEVQVETLPDGKIISGEVFAVAETVPAPILVATPAAILDVTTSLEQVAPITRLNQADLLHQIYVYWAGLDSFDLAPIQSELSEPNVEQEAIGVAQDLPGFGVRWGQRRRYAASRIDVLKRIEELNPNLLAIDTGSITLLHSSGNRTPVFAAVGRPGENITFNVPTSTFQIPENELPTEAWLELYYFQGKLTE